MTQIGNFILQTMPRNIFNLFVGLEFNPISKFELKT